MKIDILFVDLAMLSLVFIPYIFLVLLGRGNSKKMKNFFLAEAQKLELKPDEIQTWNQNIIGVDKTRRKLLFVQKRFDQLAVQVVDLACIRDSKVLVRYSPQKTNGQTVDVLQEASLELLGAGGNLKDKIVLYDANAVFSEDNELRHAEKWNRIIKELLKPETSMRPAA